MALIGRIYFEDLRNIMNISDGVSFSLYLDDIFKDLINKVPSVKGSIGINKGSFSSFIKLPTFISEKIFKFITRDQEHSHVIQLYSFIKFFSDLYLGSFQVTAELIFKIYDLDNDGIIQIQDIKHLLSFLPLKADTTNNVEEEYIYQQKSLEMLDNMLIKPFKNKVSMNLEQFLLAIEDSAEFFLQFLCFLYISFPISSDCLWIYEKSSQKGSNTDTSNKSSLNNTPLIKESPRISITTSTNFSPLEEYLKINNTPITRMKVKLNSMKSLSTFNTFRKVELDKNNGKREYFNKLSNKTITSINTIIVEKEVEQNKNSPSKLDRNSFLKKERFKTDNSEKLSSFPLRNENGVLEETKKYLNKLEEGDENKVGDHQIDVQENIKLKIPNTANNKEQTKATIFEEDNEYSENENEIYQSYKYCKSLRKKSQRQLLEFGNRLQKNIISNIKPSKKKSDIQLANISSKLEEDNIWINFTESPENELERLKSNLPETIKLKEEEKENTNSKDELYNILKNLSLNETLEENAEEEKLTKIVQEEEIKREKRAVIFHSDILKYNSEKVSFKIFFIKLIHKHIYYYKSPTDPEENYYQMRSISDCFIIKNLKPKVLKNTSFYSFSLNFRNEKSKKYYHLNEDIIDNWIKVINKATNFKNIYDFYSIGDELGKGQFGVVKLGTNLKTKEIVAIKVLDKKEIKSCDMIKNEIDILKITKHPNIVKFCKYFEDSNNIFIVMEYVNGGNLKDFLRSEGNKISEKLAANIVNQIANGLLYLKKFGIIHRDLKLINVMLSTAEIKEENESFIDNQELVVKIVDFGLSKVVSPFEKSKEICGTLTYLAPEVILQKPYNSQVDIWSLGVLLYKILSNELPFDLNDTKDNKSITNAILYQKLIFKDSINFSSEVKDFISKCLIRDNEKRMTVEEALNHKWLDSLCPKK